MSDPSELLLETPRFRVLRRSGTTKAGHQWTHDTIEHPGAVTILPLVAPEKVCLIKNYRVAVGKTLLELPAGTRDPGESPEETARRELIEETGYHCQSLELIHEFFMSPGILSERMFVFVAKDLTPGPLQLEPGEQIEPLIVPWQQAIAMAQQGEIQDAKTLVALFMYDRLRLQEGESD